VPRERITDKRGVEHVVSKSRTRANRFYRDDSLIIRDADMLRMAADGATVKEIAAASGMAARTVQGRLKIARERWPAGVENAEAWRSTINGRLDDLEAKAWELYRNPGVAYGSSGRVVLDADGNTQENKAVKARALENLLRIQGRRARLNGADKPVPAELSVHVSTEQDREIERLVADLIANGSGAEAAALMLEAVTGKPLKAITAGPGG
jgi:DNA-binding CsgD family transcriptional regulator